MDHKRLSLFLLVWLLMGLSACRTAEPLPAVDVCAAYCVGDVFVEHYLENGADLVFGDPISPTYEIRSEETGAEIVVQYFYSIRLEYDPATEAVRASPIGVWAFNKSADFDEISAEGPYAVDPDFRAFYEFAGEAEILGETLSPKLEEAGETVQYFSNARLIWQPGAVGSLNGVHSGDLGLNHYRASELALRSNLIRRNQPIDTKQDSLVIELSAEKPIIQYRENAVLQAAVFTPYLEPIENARLEFVVWREGADAPIQLEDQFTDANGRNKINVDLPLLEPNQTIAIELFVYDDESDVLLGSKTITIKSWW